MLAARASGLRGAALGRARLLAAAIMVTVAACGDTDAPAASVMARFDPAAFAAGDDWALPWPSEARRAADGRLDLGRLPGRRANYLLRSVLPLFAARLDGFSPNGGVFLPLDGALPAAALPSVTATTRASSPVQLVNIEPGSPRYGERVPLLLHQFGAATSLTPADTLVLLPLPGFPLAAGERYAALLRTGLGGRLAAAPALRVALADPASWPDLDWAVLVAALDDLGWRAADVGAATVFRTAQPTRLLTAARAELHDRRPAPAPGRMDLDPYPPSCDDFEAATYALVEAPLALPSFLRGRPPYLKAPDGQWMLDGAGRPRLQGDDHARLTLSVPAVAMPEAGFPLVIYQHGAGGDRHSFVRDGTACSFAQRGVAVLAIDFPLHGDRNPGGWDENLLLVNPENILAALDVEQQAAVDLMSLRRAVPGLRVPGALLGRAADVTLDDRRVGFVGHSQGSLVGVPFVAVEPDIHAAIFSGSGGHFITFVTDRLGGQTIDAEIYFGVDNARALADAVAVVLGVPGEPLNRFHFLLTLIQTAADPIDPVNYAPLILREAVRPRHVWQSAGFRDAFDPPAVNEALATAMGLDVAAPAGMAYAALELAGGTVLTPPIRGNRETPGGRVTAVNSQFPTGDHWVYLDDPAARTQGTEFMVSALRAGTPTVSGRCHWNGTTLTCPP